jgi:hypothetical protein
MGEVKRERNPVSLSLTGRGKGAFRYFAFFDQIQSVLSTQANSNDVIPAAFK